MHLLVPGAYRQNADLPALRKTPSQCTFWCRVLTDEEKSPDAFQFTGLNAPSGAGCLPT